MPPIYHFRHAIIADVDDIAFFAILLLRRFCHISFFAIILLLRAMPFHYY